MLASRSRLRVPDDFRAAVRQGVRSSRPSVVVHMHGPAAPSPSASAVEPTRVGFVVSRSVGGAVVRNRVKRRLRHLARPLVDERPGLKVVVRALPAAATSPRLADDLTGAWRSAAERLARTARPDRTEGPGRTGSLERAGSLGRTGSLG